MPNYASTVAYIPFMYLEFQKSCRLFAEGKSLEEIYDLTMEENPFQISSLKRRREYCSFISKRMEAIDSFIIKKIAYQTPEIGRFLILYSILKTDELFFEFMYEKYQQKIYMNESTLTAEEIYDFFDELAKDCDKIANWSDATRLRQNSGMRKMLTEAGLLVQKGKSLELNYPYIPDVIREHLAIIGDEKYLYAMVGDK
jgi:hypothetical protein